MKVVLLLLLCLFSLSTAYSLLDDYNKIISQTKPLSVEGELIIRGWKFYLRSIKLDPEYTHVYTNSTQGSYLYLPFVAELNSTILFTPYTFKFWYVLDSHAFNGKDG